jgi:hypothetical protein
MVFAWWRPEGEGHSYKKNSFNEMPFTSTQTFKEKRIKEMPFT